MIRVPPAMQMLVDVAKLDPAQGDGGSLVCAKCGGDFRWWRRGVGGKIGGHCIHCGLTLPRS